MLICETSRETLDSTGRHARVGERGLIGRCDMDFFDPAVEDQDLELELLTSNREAFAGFSNLAAAAPPPPRWETPPWSSAGGRRAAAARPGTT